MCAGLVVDWQGRGAQEARHINKCFWMLTTGPTICDTDNHMAESKHHLA